MSESRLTEERLRTWLDTNQLERERMCIALLQLNRRYTSVGPRRPKGGPDGGRDIEAFFDNTYMTYGAVGFRNSVNDSSADKNWVKKKFKSDLESALNANSELKSFIFFTNVDLTPDEEETLIKYAKSQGIIIIQIHYREKIRILLDSVEGFAIRYMYLNISLSKEEQAVFFDRFGSKLQELIVANFQNVDNRLNRIEFLHESSNPIDYITCFIEFQNNDSKDRLDNFCALFGIENYNTKSTIYFGVENLPKVNEDIIGRKNFAFLNPNMIYLENRDIFSWIENNRITFGTTFENGINPFLNINQLDGSTIIVYVTEEVLPEISGFGLVVNGYNLLYVKREEIDFSCSWRGIPFWPEMLSQENMMKWQGLFLLDDYGIELSKVSYNSWSPFRLDFRHFTPQKLSKETEDKLQMTFAYG
jgi:hypothetical protein